MQVRVSNCCTAGPRMIKTVCTVACVAIVCAISTIYVGYFHHAPTDDILAANMGGSRKAGRLSRQALGASGKASGIINYEQERWDAWVEVNNYVAIGEMYNKCEGEDRLMIGRSIMLPDYVEGGVKAQAFINLTFANEVTEGEMHIEVRYNDRALYTNHFSLCHVEDGWHDRVIHCPLQKGRHRFLKNLKISNYLPKGMYTIRGWATNQDDIVVLCAFAEFTLR